MFYNEKILEHNDKITYLHSKKASESTDVELASPKTSFETDNSSQPTRAPIRKVAVLPTISPPSHQPNEPNLKGESPSEKK